MAAGCDAAYRSALCFSLSLSIVMTLSILGMAAGVYGSVNNLKRADFTIFVPSQYFKHVKVFVNDTSRISFDISQKPAGMVAHLYGKWKSVRQCHTGGGHMNLSWFVLSPIYLLPK
mgnify:CR=1 FL=1